MEKCHFIALVFHLHHAPSDLHPFGCILGVFPVTTRTERQSGFRQIRTITNHVLISRRGGVYHLTIIHNCRFLFILPAPTCYSLLLPSPPSRLLLLPPPPPLLVSYYHTYNGICCLVRLCVSWYLSDLYLLVRALWGGRGGSFDVPPSKSCAARIHFGERAKGVAHPHLVQLK